MLKPRNADFTMPGVQYIRGDATSPQGGGVKIICHVCNDLGGWGTGFVLAISRRWEQPEAEYRKWHRTGRTGGFALGAVQFVQVEPYIHVANMIGQHGIKRGSAGPPIRYDALSECLSRVANRAKELNATVHMPRIGCGLAGGKWDAVESLVVGELIDRGVAVFVYDYE